MESKSLEKVQKFKVVSQSPTRTHVNTQISPFAVGFSFFSSLSLSSSQFFFVMLVLLFFNRPKMRRNFWNSSELSSFKRSFPGTWTSQLLQNVPEHSSDYYYYYVFTNHHVTNHHSILLCVIILWRNLNEILWAWSWLKVRPSFLRTCVFPSSHSCFWSSCLFICQRREITHRLTLISVQVNKPYDIENFRRRREIGRNLNLKLLLGRLACDFKQESFFSSSHSIRVISFAHLPLFTFIFSFSRPAIKMQKKKLFLRLQRCLRWSMMMTSGEYSAEISADFFQK